jgi:tetratricopeptide (TPR) repeat protein
MHTATTFSRSILRRSRIRSHPFRDAINRGVNMKIVNCSGLCRIGLCLLVASTVVALPASAQFKNGSQATELKLPTLSQRSIVTQRIGLTDVTVNYCRPLAGGRELFGKVIPYGQVWRAGANENTVISFTDDVSVEGKPLAAGTYGLHMIPAADQWTIIFSKNSTSWGSFSYDEKEDALRVTVKPQTGENEDALEYTFEDVKPDSTAVTMRWAKTVVPFHVSADVNKIVLASINHQLRSVGGFTWAGYDEAALWLLDTGENLDQAIKWEDRSILAEERFDNLLSKSEILAAQGKKEEAAATKAKALEVASGYQLHAYGRGLQFQKKQDEGFAIFQINIKKRPNEWYTHGEIARIASAKGDFPTAVKELNLALQTCPDIAKVQIKGLIAKAEQKQDIN